MPIFLLLSAASVGAQPAGPPSEATPASGPIDTRGSSLPARIEEPTPLGTPLPTPPTPAVFAPLTAAPRAAVSPSPTPARRPSRTATPVLVGIVLLAGALGLAGFLRRRRRRH